MNLIKYVVTITLLAFIPELTLAANHYIRDGATGGDGSSWSNAWDDLPSTLTRGDTYYIADGYYAPYLFDDAKSSTSYITIKKAIISDHGTETGWSSTYGDGQAVFTGITANALTAILRFRTGYYIFDGQTGSGDLSSSYGFKITNVNTGQKNYLMGAPNIGDNSQIDHLQISHTAFILPVVVGSYTNVGFYSNPVSYGAHDIIFSNNYMLGGSAQMLIRNQNNGSNLSNTIIENNYFDSNWSGPTAHGEAISPGEGCFDITVRNNIFDNPSVFVIGFHKSTTAAIGNRNWNIYNNIVIQGSNSLVYVWGNADSSTANVMVNMNIHHNTHINLNVSGAVFVGTLTDVANYKSYTSNNLFYNSVNPRMDNMGSTADAIIHTHNGHYDSSGTYDGYEAGTAIDATGSPFDNRNGVDYSSLSSGVAAIDAGKVLVSTFNTDYRGASRSQDNGPDMGVGEFFTTGISQPQGFKMLVAQ